MKTEEKIKEKIIRLENQIKKQQKFANEHHDDIHEKSRAVALFGLRIMVVSLKWVLK